MVSAIILLIFTYKLIPETKGKTLEETEQTWKNNEIKNHTFINGHFTSCLPE